MIQSTPLPRRSADEQARLEASLRDVFEHKLCFNELLGFKVESLDPLEPKISFAMRKDLIGHFLHGRLHGGVIATVLDTVGGLVMSAFGHLPKRNETTEIGSYKFRILNADSRRIHLLRLTPITR